MKRLLYKPKKNNTCIRLTPQGIKSLWVLTNTCRLSKSLVVIVILKKIRPTVSLCPSL